jgi:hypothetical protein
MREPQLDAPTARPAAGPEAVVGVFKARRLRIGRTLAENPAGTRQGSLRNRHPRSPRSLPLGLKQRAAGPELAQFLRFLLVALVPPAEWRAFN